MDFMTYSVAANIVALNEYNRSMAIALKKVKNGSTTENMYFLEKLEKTANVLGYSLVKIEDVLISQNTARERAGAFIALPKDEQ